MVAVNFALIIQAVNFLVFLWLMNIFFFQPLFRVMDARRRRLEAFALGFTEEKKKIATLEEEIAQKMHSFYVQATAIRALAKQEAEAEMARQLTEAARKASETLDARKREIDEAVRLAESELLPDIGGYSSQIVSRFLLKEGSK